MVYTVQIPMVHTKNKASRTICLRQIQRHNNYHNKRIPDKNDQLKTIVSLIGLNTDLSN